MKDEDINNSVMEEWNKGNIIDLNTLEGMESKSMDLSEFVGKKVAIAIIKTEWIKSKFGKDETGKSITLPAGQEIMAPILKVETVPITTFMDKEGKEIEIRASEMFSLKEEVGENGKKKIGWSTHEKGALNNFLKKMKVSHPSQLKGKIVIVTTRPGKLEGQEFLGFIKE
jgi:hypothetical protein